MKTKDIVLIPLFSALTVICSWISVPSPVPFTLSTFAVLLSCALLGGRRGTLAILLYTALGAVGLPVFSGFRGGAAAIFGATGGYIIGFILSALFMWITEKYSAKSTRRLSFVMAFALMISYITGSLWYAFIYADGVASLGGVLAATVLPFIIPDAVKLFLALRLSVRLKKFV